MPINSLFHPHPSHPAASNTGVTLVQYRHSDLLQPRFEDFQQGAVFAVDPLIDRLLVFGLCPISLPTDIELGAIRLIGVAFEIHILAGLGAQFVLEVP